MFAQSLKFFVVFFVVVDPVSLIPLFTGLTAGANPAFKRRMALQAVAISAVILLLFALGGAAFLQLMGISLEAFRIFGGLLLFLLALEMVFARESGARTSSDEAAESRRRADISVFPLAFPFIAGPAALTTILLWFGRVQLPAEMGLFAGLIAAAVLVLGIVLALLLVAEPLMRVIGVTGANVASRILGVILGALAVQFVLDGLRQAFGAS
ncbi:MAG TPA: MarC family protein [Steroidobacteraceae bacterium]|nr:NAAT family transporter [Gammaproteobacteria bacterium]HEV2285887.1 MarC family protein [Steroidobacteraceae bacterium]